MRPVRSATSSASPSLTRWSCRGSACGTVTPKELRSLLDSEETPTRYASFYTPLAQAGIGSLLYERGEVELAISRLVEVRRGVVEENVTFVVAVTSAALAQIYASLGMMDSATEMREAALEALQAPLGGFLASTVWANVGSAGLESGDLGAAEEDLGRGLEVSSASQYWEKPRLLILRALVRARWGRPDDAHRFLDEAQTFLLSKEVRAFDAHLGYARGVALLAEGKPGEASDRLERAVPAATVSGYRPLAVRISAAAASAAMARGDSETAAGHVAQARAEVELMAGSVVDEELRSSLRTAWLTPLEHIAAG